MGFDDLMQRMGKRHGRRRCSADPAALAGQSGRNHYRGLFCFGIALVVVVVALTVS